MAEIFRFFLLKNWNFVKSKNRVKEGEFESRYFSFDEEVSAAALPGYTVCLRNILG